MKIKYDKAYDYVHDVQKPEQEEKTGIRGSVADSPTPYPVENARHDYTVGNGEAESCGGNG